MLCVSKGDFKDEVSDLKKRINEFEWVDKKFFKLDIQVG